jgi:hypothetical protein
VSTSAWAGAGIVLVIVWTLVALLTLRITAALPTMTHLPIRAYVVLSGGFATWATIGELARLGNTSVPIPHPLQIALLFLWYAVTWPLIFYWERVM